MKKIYPNLHLWLLPALLTASCPQVKAQQKAQPVFTPLMSRQVTFIVHAPVILPSLLRQRQYQKMKNFLANWRNADYPSPELIFGAEALLAVETGKFSSFGLSCDCLNYLTDYAKELKEIKTGGSTFKYYIKLNSPYSYDTAALKELAKQVSTYKMLYMVNVPYYYDATDNARNTILFIQSWARDLLNSPPSDSTANFICHTLSGDIPEPKAALKSSPGSCPRIVKAEKDLEAYNNFGFMAVRNSKMPTVAVMAGGWFPTGHLQQVLGPHPSVGLQLGYRTKKNEYDITWNVRFLFPTPRPYTFVRQDTLYTSSYYDGGYIGFEYSRYVVHQKRIDLGYTAGVAYDYFSVADGWTDHDRDHNIIPLNVGSFDFNYGLRLKYFIHREEFVGLTAKYHLIHYNNDGGTDLSGNAFTVDLLFGSN